MTLAVILSRNPRRIATVTGKSFPNLRAGALRDFEGYVYPYFVKDIAQYHKTEHIFTFHNGSILEFKTYETEMHARGAKRDYLFVNEANTFDYMVYWQLDARTNFTTIIDYNPTVRFWAHEKLIGERGTHLCISDHRHNPFLSNDKHIEIESNKDPELWKVYARGKTGNVQGIVYPNWIPIDSFPESLDNIFYGIDYGYTNDPTAIVKIARQGETLYIDEVEYRTGSIPPIMIKKTLLSRGYSDRHPIYSEHDGDMIKQLRLLKMSVIAARKGPGSINAGIEKVNEFKVFYTASSKNIKRELSMYIWLTDKEGKITNTPIDMHNHALDAIRYGVYTHFYKSKNAE